MLTQILTFPRRHPDITLLIALLALFGLAQFFLGTQASPFENAEALYATLNDGNPTVVEFYSNL